MAASISTPRREPDLFLGLGNANFFIWTYEQLLAEGAFEGKVAARNHLRDASSSANRKLDIATSVFLEAQIRYNVVKLNVKFLFQARHLLLRAT